jgi:ethanolamine utilization protein EutN
MPDHSSVGRAIVALDAVGAGVGEHVFFVRGREASYPFLPAETPADACIIGIVDHWSVE